MDLCILFGDYIGFGIGWIGVILVIPPYYLFDWINSLLFIMLRHIYGKYQIPIKVNMNWNYVFYWKTLYDLFLKGVYMGSWTLTMMTNGNYNFVFWDFVGFLFFLLYYVFYLETLLAFAIWIKYFIGNLSCLTDWYYNISLV